MITLEQYIKTDCKNRNAHSNIKVRKILPNYPILNGRTILYLNTKKAMECKIAEKVKLYKPSSKR